eukprot:scaffold189224_cov36-Tisochrysis_lutea.AAC.2
MPQARREVSTEGPPEGTRTEPAPHWRISCTASATEEEGGASMQDGRARLPRLIVRDRALQSSTAVTSTAGAALCEVLVQSWTIA